MAAEVWKPIKDCMKLVVVGMYEALTEPLKLRGGHGEFGAGS